MQAMHLLPPTPHPKPTLVRVWVSVKLQDTRSYHHHINPSIGALLSSGQRTIQLQDLLLRICSLRTPPYINCLRLESPRRRAWDKDWLQGVCLGSDPRKYQKGVEKWDREGEEAETGMLWAGHHSGQVELNPTGESGNCTDLTPGCPTWGRGKDTWVSTHQLPPAPGSVNFPALLVCPMYGPSRLLRPEKGSHRELRVSWKQQLPV